MDVRPFIRALGGPLEVAKALKLKGKRRTEGWCETNHIPHKWRPHLARLAVDRSIDLPAELAPYAAIPADAGA